ncbi:MULTISPECIES: DUF5678 domain-containing protein [unclassified Streptomyces]|uniref:DUF5678 domain-containing protein n=1 Tax=unclassified Streptomyces TaxID=2593676 RepID=UPI00332FDE6A
MAARDWSKLYQKYRGQWVALQQDQVTVIASAGPLTEAMDEAKRLGFESPIMTKVPMELKLLVG